MKKNLHPIVITLIFVAVYWFCFDSKLDVNGDNASYIKLAENISSGMGYSYVDVNGVSPASHFPPGYSAILSIFISLGINNLIFFKMLNGAFLLASLLLLYFVVSKLTENKALAFTAVVLSVFSPKLIHFSFMAMSEMSYLFMSTLVFYSLYKYSEKNTFLRSPYFYLAIVAAAASYYIRTVGASLMFSILVFYAFRREWKEMFISLGGIVLLILPWSIRNSICGIESRYFGAITLVNGWRPEEGNISSVGEMVEKMIKNFDETVIKSFKALLFPFLETNFRTPSSLMLVIFGLLILAVVIYGAWRMGKLRYFILAFFAANIGLFLLWHGGNDSRYVIPITPFIFICFWVGVYYLIKKSFSPYFMLIMIFPMLFSIKDLADLSAKPYPSTFSNYFDVAKMIDKHLPAKTVICCRKPELLSFHAKKVYAINYSFTLDDKELIKNLIKNKVDFVLFDNLGFSSTQRYLLPAINNNRELFKTVYKLQNPNTYLLKFDIQKAIEKFN